MYVWGDNRMTRVGRHHGQTLGSRCMMYANSSSDFPSLITARYTSRCFCHLLFHHLFFLSASPLLPSPDVLRRGFTDHARHNVKLHHWDNMEPWPESSTHGDVVMRVTANKSESENG